MKLKHKEAITLANEALESSSGSQWSAVGFSSADIKYLKKTLNDDSKLQIATYTTLLVISQINKVLLWMLVGIITLALTIVCVLNINSGTVAIVFCIIFAVVYMVSGFMTRRTLYLYSGAGKFGGFNLRHFGVKLPASIPCILILSQMIFCVFEWVCYFPKAIAMVFRTAVGSSKGASESQERMGISAYIMLPMGVNSNFDALAANESYYALKNSFNRLGDIFNDIRMEQWRQIIKDKNEDFKKLAEELQKKYENKEITKEEYEKMKNELEIEIQRHKDDIEKFQKEAQQLKK